MITIRLPQMQQEVCVVRSRHATLSNWFIRSLRASVKLARQPKEWLVARKATEVLTRRLSRTIIRRREVWLVPVSWLRRRRGDDELEKQQQSLDPRKYGLSQSTRLDQGCNGRPTGQTQSRLGGFNTVIPPFIKPRFIAMLADCIAASGLPFTAVEWAVLREICKFLHPEPVLPSADTMARTLENMYEAAEQPVDERLRSVAATVHYAHDAWKDPAGRNCFFGLYASYIDYDFVFQEILIGLVHLKGQQRERGLARRCSTYSSKSASRIQSVPVLRITQATTLQRRTELESGCRTISIATCRHET